MLPVDIREKVRQRRHLLTFWPLCFAEGSVPRFVRDSALLHPLQVLHDAAMCERDVARWLNMSWAIMAILLAVTTAIYSMWPGIWPKVGVISCLAVMVGDAVLHLLLAWRVAYRKIILLERLDYGDSEHVSAVLDVWMPKLGLALPSHHRIFALPTYVRVTDLSSRESIYRVTDTHDDSVNCFTCMAESRLKRMQAGGDPRDEFRYADRLAQEGRTMTQPEQPPRELVRQLEEAGAFVTWQQLPQQCDMCHEIEELRPYGPNGETICAKCAFATPEMEASTKAGFMAMTESEGELCEPPGGRTCASGGPHCHCFMTGFEDIDHDACCWCGLRYTES